MTVALSRTHAPAGLQSVIARLEAAGWRIDEVWISHRTAATNSPQTR
ncbi:hypothetical protein ACFWF7_08395 [Nocardia sp. NPDC060256]